MASYEEFVAQEERKERERLAVPTQRTRTAAQGLSFGFSDELEAAARSAFDDRPYEEILAEIREGISAYKEARPWESAAFEVGGALPTAFVGAPARIGTTLLRAAGEGALYGAGTAEEGSRLEGAAGGTVAGILGGAAGQAIGTGVGATANAVTELARRRMGNRGATAVDRELQRLAAATGLTPDQIVTKIANGEIMAENKTLESVVRGLYQKGSVPSDGKSAKTIIEEGLQGRPERLRSDAMQTMQAELTDIPGPNVRPEMERRLREEVKLAGGQYAPYKMTPADEELADALQDALVRVPAAAGELNEIVRAQTKQNPFFKIDEETGEVIFTREPTQYDVEAARRAISNLASSRYKASQGAAGEAISDVEASLRSTIDDLVPELSDTRAMYALAKGNQKAFERGTKAFQGDTQVVLDDIANMTDSELKAFRAAAMSVLINRMGTARATSTTRDIAQEDRNVGMVVRALLPADKADEILQKFALAQRSQEASQKILQGSDTAASLMQSERLGQDNMIEAGISAVTGDLGPLFTATRQLVARSVPRGNLTAEQEAELAQYLVTQNKNLVERALKDDSLGANMQQYVQHLAGILAKGGRLSGMQQTTPLTVDVTKGLMGAE